MTDTQRKAFERAALKLGTRILAAQKPDKPSIIISCDPERYKAMYGEGILCSLAWYAGGCTMTGGCC